MSVLLVIALCLIVGVFHAIYWGVLVCGALQLAKKGFPVTVVSPSSPEAPSAGYTQPAAKDLVVEANGHTALFNRLMAKE